MAALSFFLFLFLLKFLTTTTPRKYVQKTFHDAFTKKQTVSCPFFPSIFSLKKRVAFLGNYNYQKQQEFQSWKHVVGREWMSVGLDWRGNTGLGEVARVCVGLESCITVDCFFYWVLTGNGMTCSWLVLKCASNWGWLIAMIMSGSPVDLLARGHGTGQIFRSFCACHPLSRWHVSLNQLLKMTWW